MQAVFEQNRIAESTLDRTNGAFGNKIGIFGKIFGSQDSTKTNDGAKNAIK